MSRSGVGSTCLLLIPDEATETKTFEIMKFETFFETLAGMGFTGNMAISRNTQSNDPKVKEPGLEKCNKQDVEKITEQEISKEQIMELRKKLTNARRGIKFLQSHLKKLKNLIEKVEESVRKKSENPSHVVKYTSEYINHIYKTAVQLSSNKNLSQVMAEDKIIVEKKIANSYLWAYATGKKIAHREPTSIACANTTDNDEPTSHRRATLSRDELRVSSSVGNRILMQENKRSRQNSVSSTTSNTEYMNHFPENMSTDLSKKSSSDLSDGEISDVNEQSDELSITIENASPIEQFDRRLHGHISSFAENLIRSPVNYTSGGKPFRELGLPASPDSQRSSRRHGGQEHKNKELKSTRRDDRRSPVRTRRARSRSSVRTWRSMSRSPSRARRRSPSREYDSRERERIRSRNNTRTRQQEFSPRRTEKYSDMRRLRRSLSPRYRSCSDADPWRRDRIAEHEYRQRNFVEHCNAASEYREHNRSRR